MKKKLIFIFVFLCMLGTVAVLYLNNFFFPVKFKEIVIEKSQEKLGRRIAIGDIQVNLIKGFVINDLTIYKKDAEEPFLQAKKTYFKIIFAPLLKDNVIFIPSLTLQNVFLNITRDEKNQWDFSDLLPKQPAQDHKRKLSITVGALTVDNAAVEFTDRSLPSPVTEKIVNVDLTSKISIRKTVHFITEAHLPRYGSSVLAEGTFEIPAKKLSADLRLKNLPPAEYLNRYVKTRNFKLQGGNIKTADLQLLYHDKKIDIEGSYALEKMHIRTGQDIDLKGNITVRQGNIRWQKGRLDVKSDIYLADAVFDLTDGKKFSGNIKTENGEFAVYKNTVDVTGDFLFEGSRMEFGHRQALEGAPDIFLKLHYDPSLLEKLTYKGTARFKSAVLTGLPRVEEIENISGNIGFDNDKFHSKSLKFSVQDSNIESSGGITGLNNPALDIKAASEDFNLNILSFALPELHDKFKIKPKGHASIHMSYRGDLLSPARAQISILTILKDSTLTAAALPAAVTGISGKLGYADQQVYWEELKATFKDKTYTLSGKSKGLLQPLVETSIQGDQLDVAAKFRFANNIFAISNLKGRYFNSRFDINGNVDISTSRDTPFLYLQGNLDVDLNDIPSFIPDLKDKFAGLRPDGVLKTKGILKGYYGDWHKCFLALTAESPLIRVSGYEFTAVTARYDQAESHIDGLNLLATAYDGSVQVIASADLTDDKIPYRLNTKIQDINLVKLKENTGLKDKDLSGTLSGSAIVKGSLTDQKDINGNGLVSIKNGRLWEMNLLKGLGRFLFIPEFDNIVFEEASADFLITDRGISTDNLLLKSRIMNLLGGGRIEFDKKINFYIRSEFDQERIAQSESLRKWMTNKIFAQTNNFINIKIAGTLDDPQYFVIPPSVNVLEEATDIIMDGLQSIFQ